MCLAQQGQALDGGLNEMPSLDLLQVLHHSVHACQQDATTEAHEHSMTFVCGCVRLQHYHNSAWLHCSLSKLVLASAHKTINCNGYLPAG